MLRDRLVCGINKERWQRCLLAEVDLDFKKALELLFAMEAADRHVRDLQGPHTSTIHRVQPRKLQTSEPFTSGRVNKKESPCYRCGGPHSQSTCRFRTVNCNNCGKKGHIAKVCRSKSQPGRQSHQKQPRQAHHVTQQGRESPTTPDEYTLYHLPADRTKPILAKLALNGAPIA